MTSEQLQQANKINGQIALIDQMEKDLEQFKKTRFSGSLPTSINRFIAGNSEVAMKVAEMVVSDGIAQREGLQKQLDTL
jgi:hypothetical protein